MAGEKRVAQTPETVAKLVKKGITVVVQKGAGMGADFTDKDYEKAGATIVDKAEETWKADLVLKGNKLAKDVRISE